MKHIRILICLLAFGLLIWLLPALMDLLVPDTRTNPFVVYSTLDSTFIRFDTRDKQVHYIDFRGKEWTKQECDSLLPAFAFRQLLAEGRLPDSLAGQEVTPKKLQQSAFHFKTSPRQLTKHSSGLYTLLESQSGQVDLVMPPDVFRLTADGIEFVDCATNQVNRAKSLSFTRELAKHGFVFPVQLIWGNGSTRKDYDNGFLLTDQHHALYQMKMVRGGAYVRHLPFSDTLSVSPTGWKKVFTLEPKDMRLIGLGVTGDNQLYAIESSGQLKHIDIDAYDPEQMTITIVGDFLSWTITLLTDNDSRYYAVHPLTFERLDRAIVPDESPTGWQRLKRYILPLRLRFASWHSIDVFPVLNED